MTSCRIFGDRLEAQLAELYEQARAARLELPLEAFAERLQTIARSNLSAGATSAQIAAFCRKLHLRDLALASACTLGKEVAWEFFLKQYGQKLYWSACRIVKDEVRARELADSLCTDLYYSAKFVSYSGRGSLESWLKATMFQAYIDHYRSERRYKRFEENIDLIRDDPAIGLDLGARGDGLLEASLKETIREAEPEEKFILAAYFLDSRSLAQIASMLRVHESTVSRRLAKSLEAIRKSIARKLRTRGVDQLAIAELLQTGLSEVSFDLRAELLVGRKIN